MVDVGTTVARRGDGMVWRLAISAVADEQGRFAPVELPRAEYLIVSCRTVPGEPAPSAIDVTARDQYGIDVLRSAGVGRSVTAIEDKIARWPASQNHPIVDDGDRLTLTIAGNEVPGARVEVVLRVAAIPAAPSTLAPGVDK